MENVNPDLEWSNFPEVSCVPQCSAELIPIVGKKFNTLDEGTAFYDVYARAAGFDTRIRGQKASRELVTWKYLVCNRQGVKIGIEMDEMHAREGFITKRRRTSKRCDCKARVSLKYVFECDFVGYVVHEFVDVHNHSLIELPLRRWMHLNRQLDDVHRKFIWDCTKANIGPTMTFKFLNEFLGGYDTVGITLTELRNYVHGLKSYVEGSDAQMLLDEMRRRKEACEGFSYQYQLGPENELKSLFWCDAVSKRNYHMYGDVVSFDSTYNTNRYCMIFSPFTGKDNHGKPVTFAAALLSDEGTESYSWLFKHFVEAMGQAPKMIVTDQDRGMRSAIRTVLVDTKHRWCMWHIMLKLTDKVPKKTLENEDLKKEIRACVWSELIEPVEFEETWMGIMERYGLVDVDWFVTMFKNRKMWVPAYFRDFPMGSLIRTTSVSESENSFYKTFTRPRSNLVEFLMSFDHALAAQRNASSKLDYVDSTITPPFSTKIAIEKHASTMYTDHMFKIVQREMVAALFDCSTDGVLKDDFSEIYTIKDIYGKSWVVTYLRSDDSYSCSCKLYVREGFLCSHVFLVFKNRFVNVIPEKYCNGRWLKSGLGKAVHGNLGKELETERPVNVKQLAKNKAYRIFYGLMQKYDGDIDRITSFSAAMLEYDQRNDSDSTNTSVGENRNRVEDFYSIERPALVEVQTPNVVQTKGSCSDSASRLVSAKEKAVMLASKPKRRCGKCRELCHHDSRNCGKNKEKN